MTSCTYMRCTNMSLQVARIRENFITIFTGKPAKFSVNHLVPQQVWSPGKAFIAVLADVLVRFVSVCLDHVLVQSEDEILLQIVKISVIIFLCQGEYATLTVSFLIQWFYSKIFLGLELLVVKILSRKI